MTFDNDLKAITQDYLAPKVVDTVLNGNILVSKLIGNGQKWRGTQIKKAVKVAKQTNGGAFGSIADVFNTNLERTKIQLAFDPRGVYMPVVIDGIERDVNASDPQAAAGVVKLAMESAEDDLLDLLGDYIYGDGSAEGGLAPDGLAKIVDDGTISPTYGGQSRSTYTTIRGNVVNVTGNLSSLAPLRTAETLAKRGTHRVDLWVGSETKFNEFESILQPAMNLNQQLGAGMVKVTRDNIVPVGQGMSVDSGFTGLMYRGAPFVADEKCPDLRIYGLNTKFLEWHGLKSSDPQYKLVNVGANTQIEGPNKKPTGNNMGIHFSGLMNSQNQYGQVAHFIILGNLVSSNPRAHVVIKFTV